MVKGFGSKELIGSGAGGGRVWMIEGGHVDLSLWDSPFVCRYMSISCRSAHREASKAGSQLAAARASLLLAASGL